MLDDAWNDLAFYLSIIRSSPYSLFNFVRKQESGILKNQIWISCELHPCHHNYFGTMIIQTWYGGNALWCVRRLISIKMMKPKMSPKKGPLYINIVTKQSTACRLLYQLMFQYFCCSKIIWNYVWLDLS